MSRYRKRPVVVDAIRVDGLDVETFDLIAKFSGDGSWMVDVFPATAGPPGIVIRTLEGWMRADLGDWIIREPYPTDDRRFYPCKASIFEAAYEELPDDERENA